MGPLDLIIHLSNFAAPALFVAAGVSLGARLMFRRSARALVWWAQLAINFAAALAVSVLGLWYFGQDGRIASYAAVTVVCASCQWLTGKSWRAQ